MTKEYITIEKSRGIQGEISVPGDKSISHRALILGGIADGMTEIKGLLRGEDTLHTLRAFQKMGVKIQDSRDVLQVRGIGPRGLQEPQEVLDLGNSGTGIRLLTGLLAGHDLFVVLTGDSYLCQRPMGRITQPLRKMGAIILGRDNGRLAPLAVQGGALKGIDYTSPVASAQVKSALLFAGLNAEGYTSVTEPFPSRDHTERMLRQFGVMVKQENNTVTVKGGALLKGTHIGIPGDFSSAAFFLVAALIVDGSDLLIRNVGVNPTRTGLLSILKRMGARIDLMEKGEGEEPVADIHVLSSSLKGTSIGPDEVPGAIDEFPVLCVAAACAEGKTKIHGASELRVKETDRIHAMTVNLLAAGVDVEELEDGMVIQGQETLQGGECDSFGDHRVAMSMAVAGLRSKGRTTIHDTGCIRTSFPGFVDLLKRVNR